MMFTDIQHQLRGGLLFRQFVHVASGLLVLGLAIGTIFLANLATDHILQAQAHRIAVDRVADMVDGIPHSDRLVKGEALPEQTVRALYRLEMERDVFLIRLYDLEGELVYISDDEYLDASAALNAQGIDPLEILTDASLDPVAKMHHNGPSGWPGAYVRTFIPMLDDTGAIGIAEIIFDETQAREDIVLTFKITSAVLITVLILALIIIFYTMIHSHKVQLRVRGQIDFLSGRDPLTATMSRKNFEAELQQSVSRAKRHSTPLALICIDVKRLGEINDRFGNAAGDDLLIDVAWRISNVIREEDHIARLSGDQFGILQTNVPQPAGAERLAQRLSDALMGPYEIRGIQAIEGDFAIGVALYPDNAFNAEEILLNADLALKRAKSECGIATCFFDQEMETAIREQRDLTDDLKAAIDNEDFRLLYQPLVDSKTGQAISFEALIRWPHPTKGMVSPVQFIGLAEETGMILPLGSWILHQACADATHFPGQCRVSVNLSPAQFRQGNIVSVVKSALATSGLSAHRLELEITEGLFLENAARTHEILSELKSLGVYIAMDDFGTGYSSLSYLWQFPFDKLKIDQTFIRNMDTRDEVRSIVNTIVQMARALNLTITAEGVETGSQAAQLRAFKCDQFQGYYYAKPMPLEDALVFTDTWGVATPRQLSAAE